MRKLAPKRKEDEYPKDKGGTFFFKDLMTAQDERLRDSNFVLILRGR